MAENLLVTRYRLLKLRPVGAGVARLESSGRPPVRRSASGHGIGHGRPSRTNRPATKTNRPAIEDEPTGDEDEARRLRTLVKGPKVVGYTCSRTCVIQSRDLNIT